jgi:hypothetical protein
MRVNVYSQEIVLDEDTSPEMVEKKGTDQDGNEETFFGIRFYLHSFAGLHSSPEDNDMSAVTFWLPSTEDNRQRLANVFYKGSQLIEDTIEEG